MNTSMNPSMSAMNSRQRLLCCVYAAIALWALLGTWSHNLSYVSLAPDQGGLRFWLDTLANAATRSITVDLLALCVCVWVWMVSEARRLQMRGVWWYVLASALIAVSVAVPVFLIHRERTRARLGEGREQAALSQADVLGLCMAAAVGLAYTAKSFGWVLTGLN